MRKSNQSRSGGVPDHLQRRLLLLFVGFNPSLRSAETGHHYANPNNRFWSILHQSGLTPYRYRPEEDYRLLQLGYGLTNIVDRPTRSAVEITREEFEAGRRKLHRKIAYYRPRVVCYVGKGVFQEYSRRRDIKWGVQDEPIIPGIVDFVAPSSSGLVRMGLNEVVSIYQQLAQLIAEYRSSPGS